MKFEKQTYTQTPNSLFLTMKDMDECELKVVMLICRYTFGYHRDEVKLSTRRIADEIGMNTASVQKGADKAVERGLIEKIVDGNKTTLWRALVSDSENESPAYQNLNRGVSDNESLSGVKESNKEKKYNPFTAKETAQNEAKMQAYMGSNIAPLHDKPAIDAFESAFGILRPWDWYPDTPAGKAKTWKDFRAHITELYEADAACFTKYVTWTRVPYAKGTMTALGIKRNPQDFPDSWACYLESTSMYDNVEKTRLL